VRNHSSKDFYEKFDRRDSWHKQHEMLLCSVQSKPRLVGSGHGQSLIHKQNPDWPAIVHLIHLIKILGLRTVSEAFCFFMLTFSTNNEESKMEIICD
jgi:hypothetical protein